MEQHKSMFQSCHVTSFCVCVFKSNFLCVSGDSFRPPLSLLVVSLFFLPWFFTPVSHHLQQLKSALSFVLVCHVACAKTSVCFTLCLFSRLKKNKQIHFWGDFSEKEWRRLSAKESHLFIKFHFKMNPHRRRLSYCKSFKGPCQSHSSSPVMMLLVYSIRQTVSQHAAFMWPVSTSASCP